MKNLIILFTRIESHSSFNPIGSQNSVGIYLYRSKKINEERVYNGFHKNAHHFNRIKKEFSLFNLAFSHCNEFKETVLDSEILLIHVSNKVSEWDNVFEVQFANYVNQFTKVYISYHESDIESGKHKLIEDFINKPVILPKKYHHHEYEYGVDNEEQLYGFLAKAIVDNEGCFSKVAYDNTVEKLISFFISDEEIEKTSILNKKLTFLHNLLGEKLNNNEISEKLIEFGYNGTFDKEKKNDSIRKIRDLILEAY